jgi:predicted RNA-binding Zn-ribbon protein involved in translation (DUF1610 family)
MNLNQMVIQTLGQAASTYWWLIVLLIIISFLKSPFIKGVIGEALVNLAAALFLDKNIYRLFKNVTLPTEDGTTQVDHVIVSPYGIFVIETKNLKGWIFGNAQQKMWTQQIYKHKNQFQNPLHQNYKHTQTLQSALEIESSKLFSLVVFVGDSDFKTPMPENVVYAGGYIRFIKSKQQRLLTDSEIAEVCRKILAGRLKPSIKTHIEHVKHVKTLVEQKQQQLENACPKCGKPMILRTAKTGGNQGHQFWGCSGYPRCRTMKPI